MSTADTAAARPRAKSRTWLWVTCSGLLVVLCAVSAAAVGRASALGTRALCASYDGLPVGFGSLDHAGMVWIAAGDLTPGSQHGYPEERGGEPASVAGFWIDRTEVTNAQFERFVTATGYVSEAERAGAAPVFHKPAASELAEREYAWWQLTSGADWRHPQGAGSAQQPNLPVVQVTHADALAYARWLGHTLPSELQWEYAAKANRDGDALHHEPRDAHGTPSANFWQGQFPTQNSLQDGFETSAPVGCYAPNPFGLFDMLGNVWEWTGSRYTSSHRPQDRYVGVDEADAEQAAGDESCSASAGSGARLALKGGSFLCAANYCARYRVSARHAQEADQPAMHIGFRTVSGR